MAVFLGAFLAGRLVQADPAPPNDEESRTAQEPLYLVLDLSDGPEAARYPVRLLDDVPEGGWTREHRTDQMVFRRIAPSTFRMGSSEEEGGRFDHEGPRHDVTIREKFWIGLHPVTQRQYQQVMDRNPSHFEDAGPDAPVEQVNWNQAKAFCAALQARLPDEWRGKTVRLPLEAEWEYAARAGTATSLYTGVNATSARGRCEHLDAIAWYVHNSDGQTRPVGRKRPNDWGLYDTLGNVWEWCEDAKREYTSEPQTDPVGEGWSRMLRGGSWFDLPRFCRAASRFDHAPGFASSFIGFRVLLAPSSLP